jgi:hypothetical protein
LGGAWYVFFKESNGREILIAKFYDSDSATDYVNMMNAFQPSIVEV